MPDPHSSWKLLACGHFQRHNKNTRMICNSITCWNSCGLRNLEHNCYNEHLPNDENWLDVFPNGKLVPYFLILHIRSWHGRCQVQVLYDESWYVHQTDRNQPLHQTFPEMNRKYISSKHTTRHMNIEHISAFKICVFKSLLGISLPVIVIAATESAYSKYEKSSDHPNSKLYCQHDCVSPLQDDGLLDQFMYEKLLWLWSWLKHWL